METTGEVLQQPGGDDDLKKGLKVLMDAAIDFRELHRTESRVNLREAKDLAVEMYQFANRQGHTHETAIVAVGVMFESAVKLEIESMTDGAGR